MPVTMFAYKRYSVRLYLQLLMSYLRYLCLWCPTHILLGFLWGFFLRLMLPFSLDCPFLISSSVLSKIYLKANWTEKNRKHNEWHDDIHTIVKSCCHATIICVFVLTQTAIHLNWYSMFSDRKRDTFCFYYTLRTETAYIS